MKMPFTAGTLNAVYKLTKSLQLLASYRRDENHLGFNVLDTVQKQLYFIP